MIKDKKYYLKLTENWKDPMPEPVIEYYDNGGYKKNIVVVRDDLLEAGS